VRPWGWGLFFRETGKAVAEGELKLVGAELGIDLTPNELIFLEAKAGREGGGQTTG